MTSRALVDGSPFDHNHADPWAKTFLDAPTLNARVSDAIVAAIHDVRHAAREERADLRSRSVLVLGPAGAGKTHLFARLRRKLGPRAIFVHLRPLVGTEMTPRYVLAQIFQQLVYETEGLKQLDALVAASLAHLRDEPVDLPSAMLEEIRARDEGKRRELFDWAVERVLERHPEADDTYLARLVETPFLSGPTQRASLAWLGGRELEESQARRLGVSGGLAEERIVQALQTLGVFAAAGTPIVLVFDQLENLVDPEGSGARVRAYGNLVAELFDTIRGVVLVQMALDSEWERGIFPMLSEAQKTRLSVERQVLALPTSADKRALLGTWVEALPSHPKPFPWPFGEELVARWCETPGLTPRMLMIECKRALAAAAESGASVARGAEDLPPPSEAERASESAEDALAAAWASHLERARAALDEAARDRRSADTARLAGGVASALRFVQGARTLKVDARQAVQLVLDVGGATRIVCILHQNHPRAVTAALDKAREVAQGAPAAGHGTAAALVVLRERALDFPPTWKQSYARQKELLRQGACWHSLERDDCAKLLALESFLASARSRDIEDDRGQSLDEAEVIAWILDALSVPAWSPVGAVTGRPLGEGEDGAYVVEELPSTTSVSEAATAPRAGGPSTEDAPAGHERSAAIGAILGQLRIVSLERLVRELARLDPSATRADVQQALDAMSGRVRWFGRSIVGVDERGHQR